MSPYRVFRRLTLVATTLGLLATPASGQVKVGLSAFAGAYLPTNDLFDSVRLRPDTSSLIITNLGVEPALLLGGRVTVRFQRFSVEAEAGYAFTRLDIPSVLVNAGFPDDASVVLGSLNLLYDLYQAAFSPLSIHLSGGAGFVARGGEFLDSFDGTTDLAAVIGAGFRYGLSPVVFLRFDLRDYISSFAAKASSGFQFESKTQNDLVGTVSVEFSLAPAR
jgi:hypothetical protein